MQSSIWGRFITPVDEHVSFGPRLEAEDVSDFTKRGFSLMYSIEPINESLAKAAREQGIELLRVPEKLRQYNFREPSILKEFFTKILIHAQSGKKTYFFCNMGEHASRAMATLYMFGKTGALDAPNCLGPADMTSLLMFSLKKHIRSAFSEARKEIIHGSLNAQKHLLPRREKPLSNPQRRRPR